MTGSIFKTEDGRDIIWQPQPGSAWVFLNCEVYEALYHGTRGVGKTDALLMAFAQHVGKGYGADWRGVLFRCTFPQLSDVIAKSKKWFRQMWPASMVKYNESNHEWTWSTGEVLRLRQFQREDDYWDYHGHEYPFIAWEELTNWATDSGYRRMMSCSRSSNPRVPRMYRATTNPYGIGHNWVKFRFGLPGRDGQVITDSRDPTTGNLEPPRIAIGGHIRENQILLAADPGYIDRISAAARNDAERKAWLKGSWDIVAGGMFDDVWDPKVHVVKPFEIPRSWRMDRSFDWGSSAPFSLGVWAESDGSDVQLADGRIVSTVRGDLYRVQEWYGWNGKPNEGNRMMATQIVLGYRERERAWGYAGRIEPGPADNNIFTSENGNCIALDMGKPVRLGNEQLPGIQWTRSDKSSGSRKAGWEKLRQRFQNAKRLDPRTPRELPGLFVFNVCQHFQRTVPVLPRDDKDLDDVDKEAEDHVGDETRYRIHAGGQRVGGGQTVGLY